MKRIAALIICVLMLVSLCACGSSPKYKAGTYEASAQGKNGDVHVTVEFSETAIVSVKVGDNEETEGIGSLAIEKLPSKIVDAQRADVDAISGATVTSGAISEAVKDCIAQATA